MLRTYLRLGISVSQEESALFRERGEDVDVKEQQMKIDIELIQTQMNCNKTPPESKAGEE